MFLGKSQIEWAPLDSTADLVDGDWVFTWSHNKRIGAPVDPVISQHFINFCLILSDGTTRIVLYSDSESLTYTEAEQIADFGAAVTSWDYVKLYGNNRFTGLGDEANPIDITGNKLLLSDGSGYLLLSDKSGAIELGS